jgi:hypothetical protein
MASWMILCISKTTFSCASSISLFPWHTIFIHSSTFSMAASMLVMLLQSLRYCLLLTLITNLGDHARETSH